MSHPIISIAASNTEVEHMKLTTEFLKMKLDRLNRQITELEKEYQVISNLLLEAEDEQTDSNG